MSLSFRKDIDFPALVMSQTAHWEWFVLGVWLSLILPSLVFLLWKSHSCWQKWDTSPERPLFQTCVAKYLYSYLAGRRGERSKYTFLIEFEWASIRKPTVGLLGGEAKTRIQRGQEGKPMKGTLSHFLKYVKLRERKSTS